MTHNLNVHKLCVYGIVIRNIIEAHLRYFSTPYNFFPYTYANRHENDSIGLNLNCVK